MNILHQVHHHYTDCKPIIAAVGTAFLFAAMCGFMLLVMYLFTLQEMGEL